MAGWTPPDNRQEPSRFWQDTIKAVGYLVAALAALLAGDGHPTLLLLALAVLALLLLSSGAGGLNGRLLRVPPIWRGFVWLTLLLPGLAGLALALPLPSSKPPASPTAAPPVAPAVVARVEEQPRATFTPTAAPLVPTAVPTAQADLWSTPVTAIVATEEPVRSPAPFSSGAGPVLVAQVPAPAPAVVLALAPAHTPVIVPPTLAIAPPVAAPPATATPAPATRAPQPTEEPQRPPATPTPKQTAEPPEPKPEPERPPATPAPTPTPQPPVRIVSVPPEVSISLTSPVKPGSSATLAVTTAAGAICEAEVYYKPGERVDKKIEPIQADGDGDASWTLKVGSGPGSWPVVVTVSQDGASASAQTTLIVDNPKSKSKK